MPTVMDILSQKGTEIQFTSPDVTVLAATQKMNRERIGSLVVMHEDHVMGMFTERDVMRRVVAEQRMPQDVMVSEVMTADVICISPDTDVEDASQIMRDKKIRHLPVCDEDGKLHGIISIGDLNAFYASHQEQTIHYLQDYIYGRA